MIRKYLLPLSLVMALVTFSAVLGAGAQTLTTARPTKVAVVDVLKIFNGLQEKAQIEADMRTKSEQLQKEEQTRRQELQDLQNDLKILAPDTQAYTQKTEQIKSKVIELRVWSEIQADGLKSESSLQLAGLYRKMVQSIGKVAKENGYDLALYKEQQPDFENVKAEAINQLIQLRKLLWSADDLDITDQVITRMNNEYKNMVK